MINDVTLFPYVVRDLETMTAGLSQVCSTPMVIDIRTEKEETFSQLQLTLAYPNYHYKKYT